MTCHPFQIRDATGKVTGGGFMCTRGRTRIQPPCKFCPSQPKPTPSTLLCDGILADGRTCDKPMCAAHAKHVGDNRDLCPACIAAGRTHDMQEAVRRPGAASPATDIRGLTLWRPWTWAICHAGKRVENRDWPAPPHASGNYLAIHAGKTYDAVAVAALREAGFDPPPPEGCPQGIVAVAQIVDVVTQAPAGQELWFSGPYGWVLDNVVVLREPVACRGAQGLWRLELPVLEQVRAAWKAAKELSHG